MEKTSLSGIERDLVLKYLIDGNAPVTVMAIESGNSSRTGVFPVAIGSSERKILEQGIILLNNPSQSIQDFANKPVRVQFYFNKLGLFFDTEMKEVSTGLALVIPSDIKRIQDIENDAQGSSDFKAILFYSPSDQSLNFECDSLSGYNVVKQPKWSDVEEGNAKKAKEYLEKIVMENRNESGNLRNGAHLISVSRYFASEDSIETAKVNEIEGRATAPKVIFIDHERIVFASLTENMALKHGSEYAMKILFPTGMAGPLKTREIFVTCLVEKIYKNDNEKKCCVSCRFTTIKTEDMRFLYEKTKNELLK